jgi:hypothetical protein
MTSDRVRAAADPLARLRAIAAVPSPRDPA